MAMIVKVGDGLVLAELSGLTVIVVTIVVTIIRRSTFHNVVKAQIFCKELVVIMAAYRS